MKTATNRFADEVTAAHRRGDETELNRLLDLQAAVKAELHQRIDQANNAAADFAHQLHAIGNLLDGAAESGMCVEDGKAVLLKGVGVATSALQDWMAR